MITNMHAQKLTQIVLLILKFSFTSTPQTKNSIGQAEKKWEREENANLFFWYNQQNPHYKWKLKIVVNLFTNPEKQISFLQCSVPNPSPKRRKITWEDRKFSPESIALIACKLWAKSDEILVQSLSWSVGRLRNQGRDGKEWHKVN